MLQLHKLIFVTQIPPSPTPNMRRLVVEQYKRALFNRMSSPADLKSEVHKLMSGTGDAVQLLASEDSNNPQPRMVDKALTELAG